MRSPLKNRQLPFASPGITCRLRQIHPMNKSILSTLVALLFLGLVCPVYSAETNSSAADSSPAETKAPSQVHMDLVKLVSGINVKFNQDKSKESDYAGELKEFDELIAKNK